LAASRLFRFCILAALAPAVARADDVQQPDAADLGAVVVSATRSERPLLETPATVTVIDSEEIARRLHQDIKDLVRYEPGISVGNDPTRFGLGGFTIRGIGGNRVLIEVDGVPVSDAFAIGSFSNAGRDFVDPELLERVEILRGAASALYGSDAIGGVVSFTTRDPQGFLSDGRKSASVAKLGYNQADASTVGTAIVAAGSARSAGLVAYTRREGHETDNQDGVPAQDSSRSAPNPVDYASESVLAKATFLRGEHELRLTVDAQRGHDEIDVISSRTTTGATAVTDLDGDDRRERTRLAVEWRFPAALGFDAGRLNLYSQKSETTQDTDERRTSAGTPLRREREFRFEQDLLGLELVLSKSWRGSAADHRLVAGFEYERADTLQQRDGLQTNLNTGAQTPAIPPDVFPVRDFPPSVTTEAGVFAQDEIELANGLVLIPGVRFDRYALDPDENDPVFVADNPGVTPSGVTETNVSPKLGFLTPLGADWRAFGQYARGFRAPPYNDVNIGFTNLMFGYTALPNPALKPETSDNFELGLRYRAGGTGVELALFHNRYDDFIESLAPLGMNPDTGLLEFQSINLSKVTIEGVELRAEHAFESVDGLRFLAAAAWTRGDDETSGQPLDSVDPPEAVVGLDYAAPSQRWGVELAVTGVKRKDRVDTSGTPQFVPPGYATVDLMTWCRLTPAASLHVGLFNLADRTYWEWADVRGRPANDPAIERYTRPGLNGSIALRVEF
jgi:hemoglobin/transferrin/lactoferrin receptor protein